MKLEVDWDLCQIHQKKGESLREFIRRFMKKKNTIPGVSDAVIMAAFRKGVKNPDLLKKMLRRQPTPMKGLFDMADRYATKRRRWPPRTTTDCVRRTRRTILSP